MMSSAQCSQMDLKSHFYWRHNIQHPDTKLNDIRHNDTQHGNIKINIQL